MSSYNEKNQSCCLNGCMLMASQGYANTILTCPEGNDVHVAADGVLQQPSGYKFSSDNVPNSGGGVSGPVTFLYAEIVPESKQLECLYQFSDITQIYWHGKERLSISYPLKHPHHGAQVENIISAMPVQQLAKSQLTLRKSINLKIQECCNRLFVRIMLFHI